MNNNSLPGTITIIEENINQISGDEYDWPYFKKINHQLMVHFRFVSVKE